MLKILFLMFAVVGCDSESDPSTTTLDALNPPGRLVSVTNDAALELRWVAANAEEDFGGYYVFATTKSLSALKALIGYPENADDNILEAGVPRCEDNSEFFEAFGIAASDADCDDAGSVPVLQGASTLTSSTGSKLATLEEDAETISGFVDCDGHADSTTSYPFTTSKIGLVKCTISKAWDEDAGDLIDIENGTTYVAMAVTTESDRETISWTSNLIEDTPSRTAFSTDTTVTIPEDKYFVIGLDSDDFTGTDDLTLSAAQDCVNATTSPCKLGATNSQTAYTSSGIYIARDISSGYSQRIDISTHSTSELQLAQRGPKTLELTDDSTGNVRVSGDSALENTSTSSPYSAAGTIFSAYTNHVFNVTDGTNYGKVIIGSISYADDSKIGDATVGVTVILQPKAGSLQLVH